MEAPANPEFSIDRNRVYGVKSFLEVTGLGEAGLRSARRNGLTVHYCHGRAFILGQDWLMYVERSPTDAPGPMRGTVPACVSPRQREFPFPEPDEE